MIVLDASALVDVLIDNEHAGWILDQMQANDLIAPAHQPAEVLSAIARLHRAGLLSEPMARDALVAASALHQEFAPPSSVHLRRAFDLREGIRVLDGLYVALAEELGAPLLTTDQRLARADTPCDILTPP